MLTFYLNRAGTKLSATQRERLEMAKDELSPTLWKAKAAAANLSSSRPGASDDDRFQYNSYRI